MSRVLAIHPPDAPARELRLAEVHRWYAPFATGGGVVAAVALVASDAALVPVMLSALILGLVTVGLLLARATRAVRAATITLSTYGTAWSADIDEERRGRCLDALAEAMRRADDGLRTGALAHATHRRIWRAVYARACEDA